MLTNKLFFVKQYLLWFYFFFCQSTIFNLQTKHSTNGVCRGHCLVNEFVELATGNLNNEKIRFTHIYYLKIFIHRVAVQKQIAEEKNVSTKNKPYKL